MLVVASAFFIILAWLFGTRRFVEAVLLTRSVCDPLFSLTKSVSRDDVGLGAAVNFAVIIVAVGCLVGRPRVNTTTAASLWLPFFGACAISVIIAPDQASAIRLYMTLVSHAAFFLLAFYFVSRIEDLRHFLLIILAGSLLPTIYGLLQVGLGWAETEDGTRVQSAFAHPNIYAFYLMIILCCSLVMLADQTFRLSRSLRGFIEGYVAIIITLIILTKTRSAWFATCAILIFYSIRFNKMYFLYFLSAPLVLLLFPELADRISDLQEGNYNDSYAKLNSYTWRLLVWQSAFEWIWQRPIFGWGFEGFSHYVSQFSIIDIKSINVESHSVFVQLIFETGFVGLTAFIWIFLRLISMIIQLIQCGHKWAWMIISLIFGYLFLCYSDNMLYYLIPSWYMWFIFGACCSILRSHRKLPYNLSKVEMVGYTPLYGSSVRNQ